jgi:hypothetical protein
VATQTRAGFALPTRALKDVASGLSVAVWEPNLERIPIMRTRLVLALVASAITLLASACAVDTPGSDEPTVDITTEEDLSTSSVPPGGSCIGNGHLELYIRASTITRSRAQTLCNAGCCSHRCNVIHDSAGYYQGWCY